jgi:AbrB family looped-hinge helix DNA binding protein
MSDEAVTVTKKGQVTIPARFRKQFNIKEGTRLLITQGDSVIIVRPLRDIDDLSGIYSGKASLSEMRAELDLMRKQDRY